MSPKFGQIVVEHASSTIGDEGHGVFAQVTTSAGGALNSARLYEETWEDKILKEHPEVRFAGPDGVLAAVANPTVIFRSATRPEDSYVYVTDQEQYGGEPLHVPTKDLGGGSGRILSAYYRASSSTWEEVWRRPNE